MRTICEQCDRPLEAIISWNDRDIGGFCEDCMVLYPQVEVKT